MVLDYRRGGSEVLTRHGGHVVHRYTKSSARQDVAISVDINDDHHEPSKALRQRILTRRAKRTLTRLTLITFCLLFVAKWTCNCRGMLRRETRLSYEFRAHPLMVQAATTTSLFDVKRQSVNSDPRHLIKHRKNQYWIDHGTTIYKPASTIPEGCEAEEWMNDLHPSCLDFHQIDMTDFFFNEERSYATVEGKQRRNKFRYIGHGGFRAAFMFHEEVSGKRRVLKTLKYDDDRDFDHRNFDRMRRDAVVSEQVSASPYIADFYGYCGQSALVDYSNGDDMDWLFDQKQKPTKDELFQIAHDVAQSVADSHHFSPQTKRATIVHMDIKPDQWIKLNGKYVLNDFNLARFLTWDPVEQENCNVASGYSGGRYQAPEQFLEESPRTEKIDVFALGNIFGYLLTEESPFPDWSSDSVEDAVSEGVIWNITDPKILRSKHPFDINVRKAMEMCLKFAPEERPGAQEVADFLRDKLKEYRQTKL